MVTKRKPAIRGSKIEVIHTCTQAETLARHTELLDRFSKLSLGNGHPEDGFLFKLEAYINNHKTIIEDVAEIKKTVREAIELSGKAIHASEIYKAEMTGMEAGQGRADKKAKGRFNSAIQIITTIALIASLYVAVMEFKKSNAKTDQKIEDLGTPVIVNSRGVTSLPSGDSIKYFTKKGYSNFKDTTK